jgi:hypothetical protein
LLAGTLPKLATFVTNLGGACSIFLRESNAVRQVIPASEFRAMPLKGLCFARRVG